MIKKEKNNEYTTDSKNKYRVFTHTTLTLNAQAIQDREGRNPSSDLTFTLPVLVDVYR